MYSADFLIERRKAKWNELRDLDYDRKLREAIAREIIKDESLRREVIDYPEKLIELTFVIVDKNKELTPFFFNQVQRDFLERLNKAKEDYINKRITEISLLVLKGRQQGFTSLVTAYQLANIILRKNFEGFTVADEADNAESIFENKAKFPYLQLPEVLKPTEKYNNKRQLLFEKLNSSWAVEVATKQIGRSRTINFLHTSEGAFWKYGFTSIQASLGEALTKDCVKIHESTANGFNDYYEMWESGHYINCFYEWYRTAEYRLEFENEEARNKFESDIYSGQGWIYERLQSLLTQGLDLEQCYWYFMKYQGYIDKDLIKQEYPCSPEEAFLMSGRPVFDIEAVVNRINELRLIEKDVPFKRGKMNFEFNNPDHQDYIKQNTIEITEGDDISFYELPRKGVPYVIGGDTKGEGSDFYTATVLNNITGNRAATLKIQLQDSRPYTWQLYSLGIFYNTALIGVEINFNTAPVEELERLKYPKQYTRQKYDDFTKGTLKKYGWKTDGVTRPLIIDKYATLIRENIDLINDIPTLQECLTFVYDKNGRPDAMSGKHDDLIFSDMIAQEIRGQQSFETSVENISRNHWSADMWEDYNNADLEGKKYLDRKWGK